ncbi:tyrosyl methionyl-tRNA synthetase, putative [Bodo saltans]|uniref:Tyrosyl methionyl-tRNA synthetase, putative n=1 Tax=Bodo saltans TaxID=75058 RepID=A0A0S4IPY2_BODSA|nr:tyrosyl methionyl-tRNA synthetase, putative [Bodo saltans]|eukprot:CUE55233.1 tyrosyl methionyl-tRNA synthetase, putative [Bodo saltans]
MTHIEGRLFQRSFAYLEKWLTDLAPKAVAIPVAAAAVAKHVDPSSKTDKKQKKGAEPAAEPAAEGSSMSKVNFLIGKVLEVSKHPESDKLYVEKIDLGEAEPRTILSGLQEHITIDAFTGKLVVVVANLEPRKIGGIPSAGMVLCASTEGKGKIELLQVPEGTPVGERIVFPGHDQPAEPVLKKKLAKHYEVVAPELATDARGNAVWAGVPFVTSKGPITSTIPNGHVS